MTTSTPPSIALLSDYSLEMTGKDVPALEDAQGSIPPGTRINVTYLGNEDLDMRVSASRAVRLAQFKPVPHISARRLTSQEQLEEFLGRLQEAEVSSSVFVVGGDPHTPEGPYSDSAEVIRTGLLQKFGVGQVSISGYPEGHPDIKDDVLWGALEEKAASIRDQGLEGTIITQFGFDTEPVAKWIAAVRERGIDFPIRVGVPGPAGIKRLLGYARRFGVASSAGIVQKYGFSLTNLLGTAGPDRFVADLAARLDGAGLGTVKLHFYTFGGMRATADWVTDFVAKQNSATS